MAQTTTHDSGANFEAQVSTDGSSWSFIDSVAISVEHSGGEQLTGSANTADGEAPVVTNANKTGPITTTVNILYTKTSNEGFDRVRDRFEGTDKTIYFRYAPQGGIGTVVGNDVFTAVGDAGTAVKVPIINCLVPNVDAQSGDPIMASFQLLVPDYLRAATTT